jgi:hypothetical protein
MEKDFEILWREELVERLQAPMNTLNRRYETECERWHCTTNFRKSQ